MLKEQIVSKYGDRIAKGDSDGSGRHCEFIQLTNKVGIKMYDYREDRNEAVEKQRIAYKHDYAPKVLKKVNVGDKFGYLTEIVDCVLCETYNVDRHKNGRVITRVERKTIERINDEVINLLDEYGFTQGADSCPFNFGYYKGKIVQIDFGPR